MNLAQLRTQVDRRTGKAQDVTAGTAYINEAIQVIGGERDWRWLDAVSTFTTTALVANYALPDTWVQTRTMTIAGARASQIYIADGDRYEWFDDITTPYHYSIEGAEMVIYPTPQEVPVIHRYVRSEPALTVDTDTPLMPLAHHTLICDLAAALFLERLDPERSVGYRIAYDKGLKRMIAGVERTGGPHRVRVRPGSFWP